MLDLVFPMSKNPNMGTLFLLVPEIWLAGGDKEKERG